MLNTMTSYKNLGDTTTLAFDKNLNLNLFYLLYKLMFIQLYTCTHLKEIDIYH